MSTNWELCLFCQKKERNELTRNEKSTYVKIETQLKKFNDFDQTYFDISRLDDGAGISKTLEAHNAIYHKKCYDNIGDKEYNRFVTRRKKLLDNSGADPSDTRPVPHKRSKTELGSQTCLFCGEEDLIGNLCRAGEMHASGRASNREHVEKLTSSWRNIALEIGDLNVHAKLSVGDVRANELFYHQNHLKQFHNRYRSFQLKENKQGDIDKRQTLLLQTYAWKQISNYIYQSEEQFIAANILETMHTTLMNSYNIKYTTHSTQFLKLLKDNVPGLVDSKLHGHNYVSLREKVGKDADEVLHPRMLYDMIERISKEIRAKLKNIKYDFDGSFVEEADLPCELLLLIELLMKGGDDHDSRDEIGFSLSVKTIAQIILYNYRNRKRPDSAKGSYQRHTSGKESPFLLYIGLKIYAATRSNEIIDILHKHGLCVSYDRILRITQGLGEALIRMYEDDDDAVIPGVLRTGLFTIGAKDNVDKNARCTVSKSHYHGTSMSLFQFPSTFNEGFERNYQKFIAIRSTESKKVRELPSFYANVEEIPDPSKHFYVNVSTINIPDAVSHSDLINDELKKEIKWLEYISSLNEFMPDSSWSVFSSKNDESISPTPILNSILPLLRQNVATYSMQKHCIEVIKNATEVLNPGQVPIDVSDQPVFALSRRLQQMFPETIGLGKYLPMFGGLHIEKVLLEIHGQLINGSGLANFLDLSKLSITGAGNVALNVPFITSARYLVQVCIAAEYKAMKLVFNSSNTESNLKDWMEMKALESSMFHYWKMIFDLQCLILMFVRSERERNFLLYVQALKAAMKYIFAFNHHHYARWLSLHLDDLMKLETVLPEVYREFCSGNFVVQKTTNPFSAIALDQAHEQNNGVIKGVGGAIGLLSQDKESALRRWEVAGPDVCRLLEEYEKLNCLSPTDNKGKHHEDYSAFQETFFNDVQKLYDCFNEIRNPFEEPSLLVLHTGEKMTASVETCLSVFLEENEKRYSEFCKHRFILCDIPLTESIKQYKLDLPCSLNKTSEKATFQANQNKNELAFAKAAILCLPYREQKVMGGFCNEVSNHPSAITEGGSVYHSTKSDLLTKRFKLIPEAIVKRPIQDKNAMIVDLSVVVNYLANRKSIKPRTLGEFSDIVLDELKGISRHSTRMDIVSDLYPDDYNLKDEIQIQRGIGTQIKFTDETEYPSDFASNFLRRNENKRVYYPYLVENIVEKSYYKDKIIVGTKGEEIIMNLEGSLREITMSNCSHPEADTKIVLHVFSCIQSGMKDIYVRSNDTDVVVILVAYMPDFLKINNEVCISSVCGVGVNIYTLSINAIADYVGIVRCKELLFLHALSGSDYTSSFYKVGKVKFWDAWLSNSSVSETFLMYSDSPSLPLPDEHISKVEAFIISLYDVVNESASIDFVRYQIFNYRGNFDVKSLPPTKDALVHHIHKSAYVAGYVWGRAHIPIKTEEPPTNWTWIMEDGKLKCQWVSYDHAAATQELHKTVFKKCSCRKGCKKSCKCKKEGLKCLPICKCRRKCVEA